MIISVEGNIGTGKSTFLRIIRDKYKCLWTASALKMGGFIKGIRNKI